MKLDTHILQKNILKLVIVYLDLHHKNHRSILYKMDNDDSD